MIDVKFTSSKNSFNPNFEKVNDVSDGSYERGFADALAKRTDLIATENGEYAPSEGSTGFKSVSVAVEPPTSELDAFINDTITEVDSGVTKIKQYAFYYCSELASANFPNATSIDEHAFYYCEALTSVNFPNVINVGTQAFYHCQALTSVDFPNATSVLFNAFSHCKALISANFPNATWIYDYVLSGCKALTSVNFPNAGGMNYHAFEQCTKLENVNFPKVANIGNYAFLGCNALTSADFPNVTSIGVQAFKSCWRLKAVILRSETMCELSDINAFDGCHHILGTVSAIDNPKGNKDGYFYVPSSLVKSYKAATNWSTYASQFRALENYTVDGTITGELDPNKI